MKTPAPFALALLVLAGCSVPVAVGVDESDANRIVISLDHASIDATKEADPLSEGRYRVVVPRDDAAHALVTMQAEGLPRPNPSGVLDVDKGALVPSRAAEHAQYMAGLAGDLERTLEGIDGVVSARIHLNVAPPDPFRDLGDRNDATSRHSSASVLLEHRGATSPIAVADVQQLIAGGVPTLAPAAVTVVMVPRAAAGADDRGTLAHLGPIAVARSSVRALQVGIAALILLVAVLAGATLVLYARLVRLRASGPSPTAKLT